MLCCCTPVEVVTVLVVVVPVAVVIVVITSSTAPSGATSVAILTRQVGITCRPLPRTESPSGEVALFETALRQ